MTVDSGVTLERDALPDRLLDLMRVLTGTSALEYARPPERLTGGFWAELMAFSLANPPHGWAGELVARLMPDPGTARKETVVQAAVAAAGFPTPAVRASGGPADGLGRAFMIMDKAPGRPLLSGLDGVAAIAQGRRLLRQIPESLAATMARLHELDPQPVRSQLDSTRQIRASAGSLLAALRQMAARYGRADLTEAAQWLIDHPPLPAPEVICHGDLHPFNLLVDGDQITVLDWSAALLGPRAYDVAFTSLVLAEPPVVTPRLLSPVARFLGRQLARRFIRSYQRHSRTTTSRTEVQWHEALVCLRALVEVSGWVYEGQADAHAGHPWLICGPAFAARLAGATGAQVRAR